MTTHPREQAITDFYCEPREFYSAEEVIAVTGLSVGALCEIVMGGEVEIDRSSSELRLEWAEAEHLVFQHTPLATLQRVYQTLPDDRMPHRGWQLETVTVTLPGYVIAALQRRAKETAADFDRCMYREVAGLADEVLRVGNRFPQVVSRSNGVGYAPQRPPTSS